VGARGCGAGLPEWGSGGAIDGEGLGIGDMGLESDCGCGYGYGCDGDGRGGETLPPAGAGSACAEVSGGVE